MDQIVELLELVLQLVVRLVVERAHAQKAGGDPRLVGRVGQLVAGQLLDHETIVWLVVVERRDHLVAIAPGARLQRVALIAVRLGEPHQVEPVAGPALAIVRAGQQMIDQAARRRRAKYPPQSSHFLRRRRQSPQIEIRPADQPVARNGRGRRPPFASSRARMNGPPASGSQATSCTAGNSGRTTGAVDHSADASPWGDVSSACPRTAPTANIATATRRPQTGVSTCSQNIRWHASRATREIAISHTRAKSLCVSVSLAQFKRLAAQFNQPAPSAASNAAAHL